jgi:hypothetical protein
MSSACSIPGSPSASASASPAARSRSGANDRSAATAVPAFVWLHATATSSARPPAAAKSDPSSVANGSGAEYAWRAGGQEPVEEAVSLSSADACGAGRAGAQPAQLQERTAGRGFQKCD